MAKAKHHDGIMPELAFLHRTRIWTSNPREGNVIRYSYGSIEPESTMPDSAILIYHRSRCRYLPTGAECNKRLLRRRH